MENAPADPRHQAAATLRRAIDETFALGFVDIARRLETMLAQVNAEPSTRIRVEVASGRVTAGGRAMKLSNRELELCLALAVHRRPLPSETLAELLFPELDVEAALNRVKVYVHRVRDKIAPDFILCGRNGYQFREGVEIDLAEFGQLLGLLADRPFLSDEDRAQLTGIVTQTRGPRNAPVWRWQWFGATELQISALASKATARLSSDAFERNALAELLGLAQFISANDPCDEQAREITIKAHLAAGRPDEALAEYKQYESVLLRDLAARPSSYLRELVESV